MSYFKSYRDMNGIKVKIGDWVEVIHKENEVKKVGKVAKITNEVFWFLSVILEDIPYEFIEAKKTRKYVSKGG